VKYKVPLAFPNMECIFHNPGNMQEHIFCYIVEWFYIILPLLGIFIRLYKL